MNPAVGVVNKKAFPPVRALAPIPARQDVNLDNRNHAAPIRPEYSYQHSGQVDNIDERDADDPLCATEYVNDMYVLTCSSCNSSITYIL